MALNYRRLAIEAKREMLIADTEAYRKLIMHSIADLKPRVEFGTRIVRLVSSLRAQITALSAIVAVLTIRRPSALVTWARPGWLIWYAIRHFRQSSRIVASKINDYY